MYVVYKVVLNKISRRVRIRRSRVVRARVRVASRGRAVCGALRDARHFAGVETVESSSSSSSSSSSTTLGDIIIIIIFVVVVVVVSRADANDARDDARDGKLQLRVAGARVLPRGRRVVRHVYGRRVVGGIDDVLVGVGGVRRRRRRSKSVPFCSAGVDVRLDGRYRRRVHVLPMGRFTFRVRHWMRDRRGDISERRYVRRRRRVRVDTASDFVQVDAHERMRKNSIALQNVAKFNRTGVSLCDTAVAEWVFSTDCEWDEPEVQEDWRGFNVPRRRTVGVSDHRANEDGKKRGVFGSDFVSNWDYVERELRVFQSFNDCVGDGELRGRREEDG